MCAVSAYYTWIWGTGCYYSAWKLILILPSHESTWVVGYIPRWFTRPQTVTHPGTNHAWRSATTMIEANSLPVSRTAKQQTMAHQANPSCSVVQHISGSEYFRRRLTVWDVCMYVFRWVSKILLPR